SADASIKSMLASLQPVEQAIGRAVTPEQWRKLEERLKGNARVARATKAHEALVRHVAANPPADMQPFIPTPAMLSPIKGLTSVIESRRRVIESRRRRTRTSSLPRLRQPRRR